MSYLYPLMEKTFDCPTCGETKESKEFYLLLNGKRNKLDCRSCVSDKNKEIYVSRNKLADLQKWRKANPEKYKEQRKRAKVNVAKKRMIDPEFDAHHKELKRLNSRKNFVSLMVSRAKQRSVKYNVPFSITNEDIIVPEKCPLLNVPLILGVKGDYQYSPSIDRINPLKGYVVGNIRVISTLANTMKNNATAEQLLTFSKNIEAYLQNVI